MLPDGTIRGMFSLIRAFDYLENKGRRLTKTMRAQKATLVDAQT